MGACCSKEGDYGDHRNIATYEHEYEHEDHVMEGEYGASIRLHGSSTFISMATTQGKKGINQDAMTVWEDFAGEKDVFFCGVFDGHGPSGHKVARIVRDQLPIKLSTAHKLLQVKGHSTSDIDAEDGDDALLPAHSTKGDEDNDNHNNEENEDSNKVLQLWRAGLLRSFREVDKELSRDPTIESYCSGTTAVTVVQQGDHLIIANLGDSRAVMCTRGDKGQVIPIQVTVDLKPSLPREAERVRSCSGRVFSLEEESHVLRLWLPDEDSPGLAMTRAFGDFCLKDYGLSATPQVFYRQLTEQDEFIVLATDGVWDVLTNFEVIKIVSAARKRSHAAKFLAAHAVRAWRSRFPSSRTDDIAVVCLFFKPPAPGKSTSDLITPDSMSHLNSSVSQHTYRSISSDADEGFDFRDSTNNNKGKFQDIPEDNLGEGESLVDTSLNFPRYTNSRYKGRPTSKSADNEF